MTGGSASGNSAVGGDGGSGGNGGGAIGDNGGTGGTGGLGAGGGFYLGGISPATIFPALCSLNTAQGGAGGDGGTGGNGGAAGNGGNAAGGGISLNSESFEYAAPPLPGVPLGGATIIGSNITLSGALTANVARGGDAGSGGLGGSPGHPANPLGTGHAGVHGAGGDGGSAQGGGAYVDSSSELALNNAAVTSNTTIGGLLGSGIPPGTYGAADDDGVFVELGGTLEIKVTPRQLL